MSGGVTESSTLPRYDVTRSYLWNYENAPGPLDVAVPPVSGVWSFCGIRVASPIGIAAGPLLNSSWLLYYASLGYSILTYKTVRTCARECYALPNLVPVEDRRLSSPHQTRTAVESMTGSWAISFGMPSMSPEVWRTDVERARNKLARETILVVSVVGTEQPNGSIEDLANDYALCARWAVESGAQVIEANFSCPNVCTSDGQLDRDPESARLVASRIRDAIGTTPFLLKIGYLPNQPLADKLFGSVLPFVNGLSMTNCIAARVRSPSNEFLFGGQSRGIGGTAIRDASLEQVKHFRQLASDAGVSFVLVGVGGIGAADDANAYLGAGADVIQIATAAMLDPAVGIAIRRDWQHSRTSTVWN